MAVRAIRRPRARTSASIAPCASNYCATASSAISPTPSASSTTGARSITSCGPIRRSRCCRRPRAIPEKLPPLEYASDLPVRKVQADAEIYFQQRHFKVGKAFIGLPVALRPTLTDGVFQLLFAHSVVRTIDLRAKLPHL